MDYCGVLLVFVGIDWFLIVFIDFLGFLYLSVVFCLFLLFFL